MWGVYRVLADGSHGYMSRTVTTSGKLAREIADDFSSGEITMPDGSRKAIRPIRCIAKEMAD